MIDRFRLIALLGAILISAPTAPAAERPNIILMMADDLGYNDLSCYGSERLRTPHLDKLAAGGVRLTSYYSGSTVCTPSRMALMTGAYPTRVGWPGGVMGYKIKRQNGLATEALTMAEIFKGAGYTTGISGKWHLGEAEGMLPMEQGFDSSYYITHSNNQTKKLWRGKELIENPFDNRLLSEQFSAEAIRFIRANRARPFFLYLPFTAPHFPAQAHPDWKDKSANHAYGDVVEELDHRVGEILRSLEEEGLADNTLVVFTSDNGPDPSQKKWASAKPFRGLKWSSLEGGTRVPCIVRLPDQIPPGGDTDGLTTSIDLLPTLAEACGIDLASVSKASPKIDGVSIWKTLAGEEGVAHARTNLLYWNGWAKLEAIRDGDWKLYLGEVKGIEGSGQAPVLIHLKEDPGEERNVAAEHPDRVEAMRALAEKLNAEIEANSIPLGGSEAK